MAISLLIGACAGDPAMLEPGGPAARPIEAIWWAFFWVTGIVTVVVFILFFLAIRRARREGEAGSPPGGGRKFVVVGGALVPVLILVGLLSFTLVSGRDLAVPESPDAEVLEVVGHQFWWEVRYPGHGVVTANEIHIPAGRPVRLTLATQDVIHSFWVPRLGGKLDMIPGRTNRIWLQAEEPGVYRGICAEFCGIQHAKMALLIIAQTPEEYAAWLERQRREAAEPTATLARRGREIFEAAQCGVCHPVRGVDARPTPLGSPGPDLTHIASRRTLGAATVPNTPETLALWIRDPHVVKPGNLMPPTLLEESEMAALVAYLGTLR